MVVFVVFGPQGSGKSTQVARLAAQHNLTVFEAGKVLRDRAAVDDGLHRQISQGILVADGTMLIIVDEFIAESGTVNGYVFDGYPRNDNQFEGFKMLVDKYGWKVAGIFINLSDKSAKERLRTRYRIVNGRKVTREDDQPEIVQKRLETFKKETLPLKERFGRFYRLLEIDGEPPMDDVTAQVFSVVDDFLDARD